MANLSSGSTVGGSPILTVNDLQTLQSNYFIAQGTKMLFQQTFAPTGWVKDTTHNNKALRVVTGTTGSGGSNAFSTVFNSHTSSTSSAGSHSHTSSTSSAGAHSHTSSTSSAGAHSHTISVNNHTLTTAQMPNHTHTTQSSSYKGMATGGGMNSFKAPTTTNMGDSGSSGGSGAHNHGASSDSSGAHTHTVYSDSSGAHTHTVYSGSSGAHTHTLTLNLNVQYVDLIIATKDSGNYFFD